MTDPQNLADLPHVRDPGTSIMLGWFDSSHLTDASLAVWSARCLALAERIDEELIVSAERTAAFRHLLEAKDCMVRAQILTSRARNQRLEFDSPDRSARGDTGGWSTRIVPAEQDQPE